MKLRFKLDQAACFRRGINAPRSIVEIEVNPASLNQDVRDMIAARMVNGIDICKISSSPAQLLISESHDIEGLIEAVKEDFPE